MSDAEVPSVTVEATVTVDEQPPSTIASDANDGQENGGADSATTAVEASDTKQDSLAVPTEVTRIGRSGSFSGVKDAPIDKTLEWATQDQAANPPRNELPVKRAIDPKEASVWGILKKNIGKNLSKISMPIALNEPLSATQRLCEELEHSYLLDKAASLDDTALQLVYIAAFAISGYGCTFYRGGRKPFNPLLGETFDYVDTKRKFRFVAEQVSHHPPLTVAIAESPNWELLQEAGADTKFRAISLKILPTGRVRLSLHRTGTVFEWNKVTTSVEDIMSGNKWVDHYGNLVITNSATKDHAILSFQEATVMTKRDKRRTVKGSIFAAGNGSTPKYTLAGKWHEQIVCPELKLIIYKAPVVPEERVKLQYGFSEFTCRLNAIPAEGSAMHKNMAITDTRLRPDQRMLELNQPNANETKLQLEQKQRERRKEYELAGKKWKPLHFTLKPQTLKTIPLSPMVPRRRSTFSKSAPEPPKQSAEAWEYNGLYWASRQGSGFAEVPALW